MIPVYRATARMKIPPESEQLSNHVRLSLGFKLRVQQIEISRNRAWKHLITKEHRVHRIGYWKQQTRFIKFLKH